MSTPLPTKKEDLRIRRTFKLLFDAMLALLKEKPFEKINVTDICDRAMVHRTTFYKYFEDKSQLLTAAFKELMKDFSEPESTSGEIYIPQQCFANTFRRVLEYVANNHPVFLSLLDNSQGDSILKNMFELVVDEIITKMNLYEEQGFKRTIPIPVIAHFRAGALVALVSWWIRNAMPIPIDTMVSYANQMLDSTVI